jgi:hypothetical protein
MESLSGEGSGMGTICRGHSKQAVRNPAWLIPKACASWEVRLRSLRCVGLWRPLNAEFAIKVRGIAEEGWRVEECMLLNDMATIRL